MGPLEWIEERIRDQNGPFSERQFHPTGEIGMRTDYWTNSDVKCLANFISDVLYLVQISERQ